MKARINRINTILTHIRREFVEIFSTNKPVDVDPKVYNSLVKMNNLTHEAKQQLKELKKECLRLQGEELANYEQQK